MMRSVSARSSGRGTLRYLGAGTWLDSIVSIIPELHRSRRANGWRYRMIYIDPDVVEDVTGERGWWFDDVVRHDRLRARRVTQLLDGLWQAREPLTFDSQLFSLLAVLRKYARVSRAAATHKLRFDMVVDYLRAHLSRRLALDELAAVAGLSPFHFLRCFQKQYHVTPQMPMALRLLEAKRLLALGDALPGGRRYRPVRSGASDAHSLNAMRNPARYQRQLRN
jgi:AraC-like DNA-binding protein